MRTNSLLLALILSLHARAASLLDAGSHCVAFKVERTSLMIHSSPIIGRNCDIAAEVLPDIGGIYRVEVQVPITGFKSNDEDRDQDIAKTLKANEQPELVFKSKGMTVEEWHKLFNKIDFELPGTISIAGKEFPLTLQAHYLPVGEGEIDGWAKVHFKDFNIEPPKIAGGIIAKTDQEIELHFHLLGSRILGADSIRPPAAAAASAAPSAAGKSKEEGKHENP